MMGAIGPRSAAAGSEAAGGVGDAPDVTGAAAGAAEASCAIGGAEAAAEAVGAVPACAANEASRAANSSGVMDVEEVTGTGPSSVPLIV